MLPPTSNNPPIEATIPTTNINTSSLSKASMLNPEYMANASQSATTSSCHILKKDQANGNIVTIENQVVLLK